MADDYVSTALRNAEILAYARDTLEQWIDGYTDQLTDGEQRHISVQRSGPDYVDIAVARSGMPKPEKLLRIRLIVEEEAPGA